MLFTWIISFNFYSSPERQVPCYFHFMEEEGALELFEKWNGSHVSVSEVCMCMKSDNACEPVPTCQRAKPLLLLLLFIFSEFFKWLYISRFWIHISLLYNAPLTATLISLLSFMQTACLTSISICLNIIFPWPGF